MPSASTRPLPRVTRPTPRPEKHVTVTHVFMFYPCHAINMHTYNIIYMYTGRLTRPKPREDQRGPSHGEKTRIGRTTCLHNEPLNQIVAVRHLHISGKLSVASRAFTCTLTLGLSLCIPLGFALSWCLSVPPSLVGYQPDGRRREWLYRSVPVGTESIIGATLGAGSGAANVQNGTTTGIGTATATGDQKGTADAGSVLG